MKQKAEINKTKKKTCFYNQPGLNFKVETSIWYIWSMVLYGAEN
jgi:hypothetical protein